MSDRGSGSSFFPQVVTQFDCLAQDLKKLQLKMEILTPRSLYFNTANYSIKVIKRKKDNRQVLKKKEKQAFVLDLHFPYQSPARKLQVPTS